MSKYFLKFTLIILILIKLTKQQREDTKIIKWQDSEECRWNKTIFNPNLMECTSCNGLTTLNNEDECVCQLGTINKGDEIEGICEKCENGKAINKNNEFCVYCLSINGTLLQPDNNGKCPNCGKDEILQITGEKNGIPTEQCIKCPKGTISDGEYCILCKNDFECFCNNSGNSAICSQITSIEALSTIPLLPEIIGGTENSYGEKQFISETISQKVQNTAFFCQQQKSTKHCQQLANFCTLQDYPRRMDGNGENCCALAKQLIPQLFYTNIEASAEIFREGAINGIFTFSEENEKNTKLEIIAMTFNENGKFLGEWTVSNGEYPILQICNLEQKREEAFKFGRYFQQKCQLSLLDILRWNKIWEEETTQDYKNEKFIFGTKTIFFELYLRYRNEEGMIVLTQIPILNEDLKGDQYIGLYGNRLGDNILKSNARLLLTKRFYLVDIQKNIKIIKEGDNNDQQQQQLLLIRVPKRISLHIHFDQTFDGHIYTPYLQLSHFQYLFKLEKNISTKNNTQLLSKTILTTKFSIEYHTESYTYDKCIEVIMATLCSLAAVWAALQTYSWSRRSGKLILIDASTIIKLLFFGADYIGNIFIGVMGSACIWLIYAYKLQTNIHYIPLNGNQENSFVAYMISALALKGIALLHTMLTLILVKTFFIDWERPRLFLNNFDDFGKKKLFEENKGNEIEIEKEEQKERGDLNKVVIWRTYLIANEWNELQLYRKTNIGIQLILMLFVMEYLNFGEWAKVQPGFGRCKESELIKLIKIGIEKGKEIIENKETEIVEWEYKNRN
ncbi:unnamed protein product [Meloidogyne enterolobii]|uniref:Uncharacterized protein n=1 Tax=Meloidogyne enterolobii TaxID=390850 RepID=A0ACB0XR32_MELEN